MSGKSHNFKKFFSKYKAVIILSLIFLFFPLLLYMIYRLVYCCYPPFEPGVLLSYYGTTFGIFGSFVTFYMNYQKEKETRNIEIKPKISVDLQKVKENSDIFKLTVYNFSKSPIRNVFLYDEILASAIIKDETVFIAYNMPKDEFDKYNGEYEKCQFFNITNDESIMEKGYPNYIFIDCDDSDNRMWQCEFCKVTNGEKVAYMNSKMFLI